jgi:3-deoxy-D-arabino-heptulosonate 7-phosphate (DAHP) synthase class II
MNLFKKVMSLINKMQGNTQNSNVPVTTQSIFSKEEVEFLLITLREGTFKGAQLEMTYNTVVKLQQEYAKINQ